ncbi:hypothetical protein BGZ65_009576 [Modicella reniformis]|uniref:histone acetyltransferase n=1 Tax=Modicella reniformis TaxID=1440133 RepID=A0A9P6IMS1_9FUNG|nr:hypothetical protein BGZ65_009576 [Modicella reniformis]
MSQSSGIERIIYIAKVDTSGCWPLPEIDTHNLKSPARALVSGYLKAMRMGSNGLKAPCISSMYNNISTGVATSTSETAAHVSSLKISSASNEETASASPTWTNTTGKASGNEEQGQQPSVKKTSLYVFARAQPQYLFKDSAKNPGKHVLNDRGLVRWWKNMITSACGSSSNSNTDGGSSASLSSPPAQTKEANQENDSKAKLRGWWLIPGIGAERQALSAIQSPIPSSASILSLSLSTLTWTYGHPDKGSKEMAQSLIPQFPDDPKSRMMRSPMGAGGMVDIDTFWELAAIGEESGAGKITGFFRVDEEHEQSQAQMKTFSKERGQGEKRTKTTVPNPLVGSTDDYTKVINRLLELDFSDPIVAIESTREWISRVDKWIKFSNSQEVKRQQKQQEQLAMDETQQQCESRVIAPAASPNMPSWIQRRVVSVWLQSVEENKETGVVVAENAPTTTGQQSSVVNSLSAGFIKRKPFDSAKSPQQPPVVNVLSAGLTKRKAPDSTPATATPAPPSPPTSAPVEASVAPETSASSAPAVNVLGASFIKKRKVDS